MATVNTILHTNESKNCDIHLNEILNFTNLGSFFQKYEK